MLPNIAFIGGGGETAYWLELKDLFGHYQVPFPVLLVRNSFLIIEQKWQEKIQRLGLNPTDLFQSEQQLLTEIVSRHKNGELKLKNELEAAMRVYDLLKDKAANIDQIIAAARGSIAGQNAEAIAGAGEEIASCRKKKYETEQRQIQAIRAALFPRNGLQERIENFYALVCVVGKEFIHISI